MPYQTITIPLSGQPDQKTSRIVQGPTVLRRQVNIDHNIRGEVKKRRGFQRLDAANTIDGQPIDEVLLRLADNNDELVVVGRDNLYAVSANDDLIGARALVFRGPAGVGNYNRTTVHVSAMS